MIYPFAKTKTTIPPLHRSINWAGHFTPFCNTLFASLHGIDSNIKWAKSSHGSAIQSQQTLFFHLLLFFSGNCVFVIFLLVGWLAGSFPPSNNQQLINQHEAELLLLYTKSYKKSAQKNIRTEQMATGSWWWWWCDRTWNTRKFTLQWGIKKLAITVECLVVVMVDYSAGRRASSSSLSTTPGGTPPRDSRHEPAMVGCVCLQ